MGHKIRANREPITKAILLAHNLDQKVTGSVFPTAGRRWRTTARHLGDSGY
jgi:hypothetical protein